LAVSVSCVGWLFWFLLLVGWFVFLLLVGCCGYCSWLTVAVSVVAFVGFVVVLVGFFCWLTVAVLLFVG
jgi:membrane-anchored protein YejM (alkaline phosphatase superfamily)